MSTLTLISVALCVLSAVVFTARLRATTWRIAPPVAAGARDAQAALGGLLPQRGFPIAVKPLERPRVNLHVEDVAKAVDKLRFERFPGMPLLLHSAMLFGLDMEAPQYPSPDQHPSFRQVIFDRDLASNYFTDGPVFIETSSGLRNRVQEPKQRRWQNERQAHPGQLLAELAKHGVPLEHPLTTEAGSFTLADLLRDTLANYDHDEPEIEWICLAVILYLPPQKAWTDKFGQRFSFDQMADELLRRDMTLPDLPCYGTHILEALVVLLRVDAQHAVLSDSQRARVRQHLSSHVAKLRKTQLADGSWPTNWNQPRPTATDLKQSRHARVHLTGHHLDWMLLLPRNEMPPDDVFFRAATWLLGCLLDCNQKDILDHYCPYSHAAHVLITLASDAARASPPATLEEVKSSASSTSLHR